MRGPRVGFPVSLPLFGSRDGRHPPEACYKALMKPGMKSAIAAVVAGTSVFAVLRWLRSRRGEAALDGTMDDRVEEADKESFPASDPPSWTLGIESEA